MKLLSVFAWVLAAYCATCGPKTEMLVDLGEAKLFCKEMGKGDALLIIHGGPGLTMDYLVPQLSQLSENHRVIFYDQRYCGRSVGSFDEDAIHTDVFVEDIEAIRKAYGLEKMTVMGHSWGAFLAMNYAIAHPESIDKLILLNPHPASSEGWAEFFNEAMRRLAPYEQEMQAIAESQSYREGDPATVERYYGMIFQSYCHNPEKASLINLKVSQKAAVDGAKVCKIFCDKVFAQPYDCYERSRAIQIPTLIIHGVSDPIPVATVEKLHACIPNSKYILLQDCGHFPYVETPGVFFEHLNAFLRSH